VPGWKERRVIEMAEIGNDEKGKENPSRLQPTILIHRRHLRDGKKKKKLKRLGESQFFSCPIYFSPFFYRLM